MSKLTRREVWTIFNTLKDKKGCECNECTGKSVELLFHHPVHRNIEEKMVSTLLNDGAEFDRVMVDVKFCRVMCRSCHAKLHHGAAVTLKTQRRIKDPVEKIVLQEIKRIQAKKAAWAA